ncbi:ParA family protein [Sedimentibacter sp. zth1]|uniref:ParA family protein n=1 Tax=Sedimentibacter sp. zth1 TaxID=2816908 RepID=UPI001A91EE5E|nr:AAA family ATPase [Sedimentibacter sp. zth1]QSX05454.1 ParA family protein [Sedimentibacter sp. zth1]
MSKIISIINQKGGVGKTTTTINLGVALAKLDKKVLLVDFDPQANLTIGLGFDPDEIKNTISSMIRKRIADDNCEINIVDYILKAENLDIIPSDIGLSGIEMLLFNTMNRENVFKNIIEEIKVNYDYILIDCMPSLNILPINALVASDSVIIPVQAHFYSLTGMEQLFETIKKVRRQINRNLEIEGVLLTMYDSRTSLSREVEKTLKSIYGETINIFKNKIVISTKAAEAPSQGKSLLSYQPRAEAAKNYHMLAEELLSI